MRLSIAEPGKPHVVGERERERLVRLVRLVRNRTTARRGCTARKVLHLCGARLEVLSVFTSLCPRLTRKGRAGSSHAILRRPVEVRTGKYEWTLDDDITSVHVCSGLKSELACRDRFALPMPRSPFPPMFHVFVDTGARVWLAKHGV